MSTMLGFNSDITNAGTAADTAAARMTQDQRLINQDYRQSGQDQLVSDQYGIQARQDALGVEQAGLDRASYEAQGEGFGLQA